MFSGIYYRTTYLVLYCMMNISFSFKEYRNHKVFWIYCKNNGAKFLKILGTYIYIVCFIIVLDVWEILL